MGRMAENCEIQGRLWHFAVDKNIISAKRKSLHRGLAQIPKILRYLIHKEINSNPMAKCPTFYIKEAERNYFSSSIRIYDAIL